MGSGEGGDAAFHRLDKLSSAGRVREAYQTLHNCQDVPGAMVQLAHQERLLGFRHLPIANVP